MVNINRGVIPRLAAEIEKLRQNPHVSRAQLKKILEVTHGDITGLKVGRRPDSTTVFIVYHGKRYDIDQAGALSREERIGGPNLNIAKALAKKLDCPLCGQKNDVAQTQIHIKCKRCGFPLRRVRVKTK